MAKKRPAPISSIGQAVEKNETIEKQAIEKLDESKSNNNATLVDIELIDEIKIFNSESMHNRTAYSKEDILNLAHNMIQMKGKGCLETGVIQPIIIREKKGRYERISGFRRIEACKINREDKIPAIVLRNIDDATARFMRSSENLQREANNPYDELVGILENIALLVGYDNIKQVTSFLFKISNSNKGKSSLSDEDNKLYIKFTEILERIGRYSLSALTERLTILNFKEIVLKELIQNSINYTEAKLINRVKDEKIIQTLLNYVKTTKPTITILKQQISNLQKNKNKKLETNYDILKKQISYFSKSDYKKLSGNKKILVDKAIDDITERLNDIRELVEKEDK